MIWTIYLFLSCWSFYMHHTPTVTKPLKINFNAKLREIVLTWRWCPSCVHLPWPISLRLLRILTSDAYNVISIFLHEGQVTQPLLQVRNIGHYQKRKESKSYFWIAWWSPTQYTVGCFCEQELIPDLTVFLIACSKHSTVVQSLHWVTSTWGILPFRVHFSQVPMNLLLL